MDLACANPADNRNLAERTESVFLDIETSFPILKLLLLRQPLTSILEVLIGKTSQNVQAMLLMERLLFCREILNPIPEKPNPS